MGVTLIAAVLSPAVCYVAYRLYMKMTKGVCNSKADMTNKTVIITGCDKGIGYYTAVDLARRNARVIMACRNLETARRASEQIKQETGNNNIVVHHLDVSSLESVRKFAKEIQASESRLDVLVNNAGIGGESIEMTDEGFEIVFATNYLGSFLLTLLLLDLLKRSAPSRIINVSSGMHSLGAIDMKDLTGSGCSAPIRYSRSKTAQILFTLELSRRLRDAGVTVNALHPGAVWTNIFRKSKQPIITFFFSCIGPLFFRTAKEGAQTSIYLAVSEEVAGISGKYFSECKLDVPAKHAQDDGVAKKLFELSEKLCGLVQNPVKF